MLDAFECQIVRTLLLRNITKTVKDITSYGYDACDITFNNNVNIMFGLGNFKIFGYQSPESVTKI